MKKRLFILAVLVCLVLCACSVSNEDMTGDVKNDTNGPIDTDTKDNTDNTPVDDEPDNNGDEEIDAIDEMTIADYIDELVAYQTDNSPQSVAFEFCDAIMLWDKQKIAEFTQGNPEYYDFIDEMDISSYNLCSFDFSDEVKFEMSNRGIYNGYNDKYFVEFDVESSTVDGFSVGKCIYYLELNKDEALGNVVEYFMPADNALKMYSYDESTQGTFNFISEMLAESSLKLEDGRNYPDSFDFTRHAHLITHLMADSGYYASQPPYSLNEINDFISNTFDGNSGIELRDGRDIEYWLFYDAEIDDTDINEQEIFGCSFAHGGTTVIHTVDDVVYDGNSADYYVTVYADYAHLAMARKLVFTFEEIEGEMPKLTMIVVSENNGRDTAGYAF